MASHCPIEQAIFDFTPSAANIFRTSLNVAHLARVPFSERAYYQEV